MQGSGIDIGDVHRYLGNAVFVDVPAYGLASLEGAGDPKLLSVFVFEQFARQRAPLARLAALLAHIEGHCHSAAGRCGVEVVVYGYEEIACTYVGGSGPSHGIVPGIRKIGLAGGVRHLVGESLILAGAAYRKVAPLGFKGGGFVTVAGDSQFFKKTFGEPAGKRGALFKGDSGHRDEWKYVGGSAARVGSVMDAHIDEFRCFGGSAERSFQNVFRLSYESHYGAVCGLAGIDIQYLYFLYRCNSLNYTVDDRAVASLAEIRHAFDDSFHYYGYQFYPQIYRVFGSFKTISCYIYGVKLTT